MPGIPLKNAYRGGGTVSRLSTNCCIVWLVCCEQDEHFHRHETARWLVNYGFPTLIIASMLLSYAFIILYAFLYRNW